jgi:hypothetical protein
MGELIQFPNPYGKCVLCGKQISKADGDDQKKRFGIITAVCDPCGQEEEDLDKGPKKC